MSPQNSADGREGQLLFSTQSPPADPERGTDLPAPDGKLVLLIGKLGPKTWFELSFHSCLVSYMAVGICLAFVGLQVDICEVRGVWSGPSSFACVGGRLAMALCRMPPCQQVG